MDAAFLSNGGRCRRLHVGEARPSRMGGTDSKQADTEEKPGDAANLDQWETLE